MLTLARVEAPHLWVGKGAPLPATLNAQKSVIIFALLLLLSLPIRLINLKASFSGEHEFRQTQTALSVWEIREHGFSLLHPRLPLFGPPWECPFEYPVFQTVAALVDSIAPWSNLDVSIRLTNLLFFYLTAVSLAVLARLLFKDSVIALFTSAIFLFSPYNAFWSRTSMIEYAATFFGLVYLITFIRWTFSPGRMMFAVCLALGILGCLTKATSFVIPLIAAATLGVLRLIPLSYARCANHGSEIAAEHPNKGTRLVHMLGAAALLLIPLLVGFGYIHFGDLIKEQHPYTAWLSSRHAYTRNWTYGSWAQRANLRNWNMLWGRMQYAVMPSLSLALIIGWLALPFRVRQFAESMQKNFWLGCAVALAPVLVIFIFYNLFVIHTYYMIACAPFLALFAGAGLGLIYTLARTVMLRLCLVLLLSGLELQEWSGRCGELLSSTATTDARVVCLTEASQAIPKDEAVIILSSSEWSSFGAYYLKRPAFMAMLVNKPVSIKPLLDEDYFKKNGFHWLLVESGVSSLTGVASQITAQWKHAVPVPLRVMPASYTLYSLSDE